MQETMHPFWAARRLTQEALNKEQWEIVTRGQRPGAKFEPVPEFTCELVEHVPSISTVMTINEVLYNQTKFVKVPRLTNTRDLLEGEEFILKMEPTVKEKKTKERTWNDVSKDLERTKKKTKDMPGKGDDAF